MASPTPTPPTVWDNLPERGVPSEAGTPSTPVYVGWDKPSDAKRKGPTFRISILSDPSGKAFIMEDEAEVARLSGLRPHSFYTALSMGCGCLTRSLHKLDVSHPAYAAVADLSGAAFTHILITRISAR